ncbi:MAG: hypothetical protein V2G42_05550 [bacterium JZ-2024 1]
MGKIRVEMKAHTKTGRKKVVVYYESDPGLTYQEHLARHHELIRYLLSIHVIHQQEVGDIEFRVIEPQTVELEAQVQTKQEREEKKETA